MEDSDVQRIKEHIVRAERVLSELKNLDHGKMGEQLLEILREVSIAVPDATAHTIATLSDDNILCTCMVQSCSEAVALR